MDVDTLRPEVDGYILSDGKCGWGGNSTVDLDAKLIYVPLAITKVIIRGCGN